MYCFNPDSKFSECTAIDELSGKRFLENRDSAYFIELIQGTDHLICLHPTNPGWRINGRSLIPKQTP